MSSDYTHIFRIISMFFFVCAGILFAACLSLSVYSIYFKLFSIETSGTVKQFKEDKGFEGIFYAPVFSFTARDGIEYEGAGKVFSMPQIGEVGDKINVIYFEKSPQSARIDKFMELFGFPLFLGAFGIITLILGFLFYPGGKPSSADLG